MYNVYKSITGTSNIELIKVTEAHQDTAPMAIIEAETTSLTLGDEIEVFLGYVGDNARVFKGYVKEITRATPPTKYKISAYGVLVRAADYFIAADNPDNPFTRSNITAEKLVEDLLALAGLTNYNYEETNFTFGTQSDVEVNLTSVYEFCSMISRTLAWHLYGDQDGTIHFVERWNGLMTGDSSTKTVDNSKVLQANRITTTRDLRNKVVVYGGRGISAVEKTSSPHLPSGFYQTTVASAEWIDSQAMADKAAERNLDLLNKLGEICNVKIVGDSSYEQRQIVEFNYSDIGASGDWYVTSVSHTFTSSSGYETLLTLKK